MHIAFLLSYPLASTAKEGEGKLQRDKGFLHIAICDIVSLISHYCRSLILPFICNVIMKMIMVIMMMIFRHYRDYLQQHHHCHIHYHHHHHYCRCFSDHNL